MRTPIVAAMTAALGLAVGWLLRGKPSETVRVVTLPSKEAPLPQKAPEPKFPDYPKPTVESPKPVVDEGMATAPPPLVGDLPSLPAPGPGGPLEPSVPGKIPAADLNADEALARRVILQSGGEIVSSADAKDSMGKVGRTLVAETDAKGRGRLQDALRRALGDRAILSDAGSISGPNPLLRKAEEALETKRKERDKARLDFMPEAPILRGIEEEYAAQEHALADLRKSGSRLRLNILLRPVLGAG